MLRCLDENLGYLKDINSRRGCLDNNLGSIQRGGVGDKASTAGLICPHCLILSTHTAELQCVQLQFEQKYFAYYLKNKYMLVLCLTASD